MDLTDEEIERLNQAAEIQLERAKKMQGGDEQGWGSWLKDVGKQSLDNVAAAASSGANALSLGAAPAIVDRGLAAFDAVSDGGDMSYADFLQKRQADRRALEDQHPVASTLGAMAGSVAPAMQMANTANALAQGGNAMAKMLTSNAPGRIAAATGVGAATNLAQDLGNGRADDVREGAFSALVGGAGGAVGQTIGELLPWASRVVKERVLTSDHDALAKRRAGESLFNDAYGGESVAAAANQGKGLDKSSLIENMQKDQMLGEQSQGLLDTMANLAQHKDVTGMTGPAAATAQERLKEFPEVRQSLFDLLDDPDRAVTGKAAKQAMQQQEKEASALFKEIFDGPEGSSVPVMTKTDLAKNLKNITHPDGTKVFDSGNANSSSRAAYDYILREVKNLGGPKKKDLSLKGLQGIKLALDDRIAAARKGASSAADLVAVRDLIAAKKHVSSLMLEADPRYAEAAAQFAEPRAAAKARELGRDLIKGTNTSMPLDQVSDYLQTLSPAELGHAQDAAKDWLSGQVKQNPNFMKKLAQENPALLERITMLFGDAIERNATSLEEIAEVAGKVGAREAAYAKLANAPTAGTANAAATPAADAGIIGNLALGAAGSKVLHNQAESTGLWSNLMRLNYEPSEKINQTLFNVMQQKDPTQAQALLDELWKASRPRPPSFLGGFLGATGAGSIME